MAGNPTSLRGHLRLRRTVGEKLSTWVIKMTHTDQQEERRNSARASNHATCKRIERLLRPVPKYGRCHSYES